jgi:hypothetical protein
LGVRAALLSFAFASVAPMCAAANLDGDVELQQVRFETTRGPGGTWYVINVDVAVKPAPANPTRFVDRVKVGLALGFEISGGSERRHEFYRAEATAVSVATGRATFRFYLPPEVVERDRLQGEARYHFVELAAAGRAVSTTRKHVSSTLPTPEALASFRARIAAEAPANDGILLPQPLTPFSSAAGGPPSPTLLFPR